MPDRGRGDQTALQDGVDSAGKGALSLAARKIWQARWCRAWHCGNREIGR